MGLVWSASGPGSIYAIPLHSTPVTITAKIGNEKTSVRVEQRLLGQHVTSSDVRDHGLYGKLFRPSGRDVKPGLLVFGGSDGGLSSYAVRQAALFADHSFVALALAYFGVGSLPKRLVNISLEYFGRAIEWLQGQGGVRGDELALILGSHYPELGAVVSYVGSGLVAPSPDGSQPAWTFRGKPLPRIPYTFDLSEITPAQKKRAEIPVARINGPVLLISADDDSVWPSTQLSRIAMERLRRFDHPYQDEFVHYPGAGHGIQPPYLPTTVGLNYFGGDPKHNAEANEDSWPRVLRMLDEHLRP